MTGQSGEPEFIREFRRRVAAGGGVFATEDGELAIFDAEAAQQVNLTNWHGFMLPERLVDLVRRRPSTPVRWAKVRSAWTGALRAYTTGEHNARMAGQLARMLDDHLDRDLDLVVFAQDLAVDVLLPIALTGLSPREHRWIRRDLEEKLRRLLTRERLSSPGQRLRFFAGQLRAGLVVRRVIRQRAGGRRARPGDLADPIIDMLPELGMDRTLDTVTTVVTAIGGPPGAAATSLLYELARHPEWADRLRAELRDRPVGEFHADPVHTAPTTYRFVKEVLRMWSPPLLLGRVAQKDIPVGDHTLRRGQPYIVSAYLIHRDERNWPDADAFDPDRWLPQAPHGSSDRAHYVPFGWAPKACVGADLGTNLLMVLAHLMVTGYRLDVPGAGELELGYFFAAVPREFRGRITRRELRPAPAESGRADGR